MTALRQTRDGRTLCNAHRTTGAPRYHYAGCTECEAAKARGIVRPPASEVPPSKRRGKRLPGKSNWGAWGFRS